MLSDKDQNLSHHLLDKMRRFEGCHKQDTEEAKKDSHVPARNLSSVRPAF